MGEQQPMVLINYRQMQVLSKRVARWSETKHMDVFRKLWSAAQDCTVSIILKSELEILPCGVWAWLSQIPAQSLGSKWGQFDKAF